jgi:amino acid transporter
MAAGEAERATRKGMQKALESFGWCLMSFFCLGAPCVGVVFPYNAPSLAAMLDGTREWNWGRVSNV